MRRMNRGKAKANNAELNSAILLVLSNKYKKDAKEAHKIVENAGYVIYKYNGHFVVQNRKNWKSIYIYDKARWRNGRYVYDSTFSMSTGKDRYYTISKDAIDFVDYLDTPYNTDKNTQYYPKYYLKREKIRSAKRDLRYYTKDMESVNEKINQLKRELEVDIEYINKANKTINDIKAEIREKRR